MKNFLPKTTSALSSSIIVATLLAAPIVMADDYTYNPSVDLSGKFSKKRNIAEFNYMQPLSNNGNTLPIFDLKLKTDNKKSKEINLGLVLRHNYNDNVIIGAYAYFDHRNANKLKVNSATLGVEALSKYIDARANIYIPKNKRKKLANKKVTTKFDGTSMFALSGGDAYQSSFGGYDVEIGTPIFAFSDILNEKIGTKIHVAKYKFKAKNMKSIKGTRVRLEQDIATFWAGNDSYKLYMNAETQKDAARGRQNFVGLGVKATFNDKANIGKKKPNSLSHRMMDTVVRDVDVVFNKEEQLVQANSFYRGNTKIDKHYFVKSMHNGGDNKGDGTKDNPLSFEQLNLIDNSHAIVTQLPGDRPMTRAESNQLNKIQNLSSAKNSNIELTAGNNKFTVSAGNGVLITSDSGDSASLLSKDDYQEVLSQKLNITTSVVNAIVRMKIAVKKVKIERAKKQEAAITIQSAFRVKEASKLLSQLQKQAEVDAADNEALERLVRIMESDDKSSVNLRGILDRSKNIRSKLQLMIKGGAERRLESEADLKLLQDELDKSGSDDFNLYNPDIITRDEVIRQAEVDALFEETGIGQEYDSDDSWEEAANHVRNQIIKKREAYFDQQSMKETADVLNEIDSAQSRDPETARILNMVDLARVASSPSQSNEELRDETKDVLNMIDDVLNNQNLTQGEGAEYSDSFESDSGSEYSDRFEAESVDYDSNYEEYSGDEEPQERQIWLDAPENAASELLVPMSSEELELFVLSNEELKKEEELTITKGKKKSKIRSKIRSKKTFSYADFFPVNLQNGPSKLSTQATLKNKVVYTEDQTNSLLRLMELGKDVEVHAITDAAEKNCSEYEILVSREGLREDLEKRKDAAEVIHSFFLNNKQVAANNKPSAPVSSPAFVGDFERHVEGRVEDSLGGNNLVSEFGGEVSKDTIEDANDAIWQVKKALPEGVGYTNNIFFNKTGAEDLAKEALGFVLEAMKPPVLDQITNEDDESEGFFQ